MNKASSSLKQQFTTLRILDKQTETINLASPMIERQHVTPILDLDNHLLWGRQIVPLEHEIQSRLEQCDIMFPIHDDMQDEQARNLLKEASSTKVDSDQQVASQRLVASPQRRMARRKRDYYDFVSPIIPMSQHEIKDGKIEPFWARKQAPNQIVDGSNHPYGLLATNFWTGKGDNVDHHEGERREQDDAANTTTATASITTSKKKKTTLPSILPPDFQPSPYSVVVGKGKESKNVIGNGRLRVLASNYLQKYGGASDDRQQKSDIVSTLIDTVRNACPMGAFIRLGKDGRWYEVTESVAREKVGYTFRELLGDNYRSSSKAKAAMRSKQRTIRTQEQQTKNRKVSSLK
jgi:hypothetical protein